MDMHEEESSSVYDNIMENASQKPKTYVTLSGNEVYIISDEASDIESTLRENRNIEDSVSRTFFEPDIWDLHDPFLMPDMDKAVSRVLEARTKKERVVVFGDYDVDGVSSTALLVRFLTEIGMEVSYRLPHRVHDGYGLKEYFFTELAEKNVKLVITVDCGTRDIEPIKYAKSLGIDIIVTDHHSVPETIPTEVIAILNPKRKDSLYPFESLAWAGVAFKLLHGVCIQLLKMNESINGGSAVETARERGWEGKIWKATSFSTPDGFDTFATKSISEKKTFLQKYLMRYIDFASLWTVADCMPLIGENRTITTLGLRQMQRSESAGLRKFLEGNEKVEWNADIIGFQIGPRINASGRMDTPMTALRWLLASEERCDEFLSEIEELNIRRQEVVKSFTEKALESANSDDAILFFVDEKLEHGLIGLVAGKLTETYNRPAIVLCRHENEMVASCRSPEWCNLIELLDMCKHYFLRYGGHRQAAGFSIAESDFESFKKSLEKIMHEKYDKNSLPQKRLQVECRLALQDVNTSTLKILEKFRPFGIGNRKPLFLLENLSITDWQYLGKEQKHLSFSAKEIPGVKCIVWNIAHQISHFAVGNVISIVTELDGNEWHGKVTPQCIVREIIKN